MKLFLSALIFLLSCPVLAREWLFDIEAINRHLSQQQIDEHLRKNEPVPWIYVQSIAQGPPLYDLCPELKLANIYPRYEVLFLMSGPEAPEQSRLLMMKIDGPSEEKEKDPGSGEVAIVNLKRESMKEMFSFVSPLVEFRYATGMQAPGTVDSNPANYVEASQVNWLKRADLKLHLSSKFHLLGDVVIQETLGPADPKEAEQLSDSEKMKFHTNQVNVNIGTETNLSQKVTLRTGLQYEDGLAGKSAGVLSGIDVQVATGTRLLLFSSYKLPITSGVSNILIPDPGANQGGSAGVRLDLHGVQIKGTVNGLGSNEPMFETGVVIPLEIPSKK